jgi:hypothetical protein
MAAHRRRLEEQYRFHRAVSAQGDRLLFLDKNNQGTPGRWSPKVRQHGYAAMLASGGRFRTIALDFDGKTTGADAAIADADLALTLLALGGIQAVMCASGSAGGRHVIFTVHEPGLSAARTRQLVDRMANLGMRSLDKSNLTNGATGAIRPPLAPRRQGYGHSRVLGPRGAALSVLERGNPPEAVSRLVEELAGPGDRRPQLRKPEADDARRRPPGGLTEYRSGSEALMALATRVANRTTSQAQLIAEIGSLDPDDPIRRHLRRRGADAERAVGLAWDKAVELVAERPAVAVAFVPDDEVLRQWRVAEVGRLAGAQGRVALAALAEAEAVKRRLVGLPVRSTAERAGLSKSQTGRALRALVKSNVLELASAERGARGNRYRLMPVDAWSADARGTVGTYPSWGGVGMPTVPPASPSALALADDTSAEVWSAGGLGEPGRRVYRALAEATMRQGGASTAYLAAVVERTPRTVGRTLGRLLGVGLARRADRGVWIAESRDAVDLAFDLGVVGTNAARVALHEAERREDAKRRIGHRLELRGVEPIRQVAYNPSSPWAKVEEDFGCSSFPSTGFRSSWSTPRARATRSRA